MQKISGVKIEKDSHGRARKITFDLKVHGDALEDYIDNLIIDSRLNEETIPWEEVKAMMAKKIERKASH